MPPPAPPSAEALLELFGELTGVMFCAKDAEGRYTEVNDAFVRRTRERTRAAVLGRRARDLFVPALAERYEEQDAAVLATGRPLRHELELIRRGSGAAGWYVTTKLPVHGAAAPAVGHGGTQRSGAAASEAGHGGTQRSGAAASEAGHGGTQRSGTDAVVGVVSVSEDLRSPEDSDPALPALARAVELAAAHPDRPPRVEEMAAAAGCSTSALERRMRRVFGLAPTQFVLRTRIDHARALLADTSVPLAEVAAACGFHDQPAFTRQFARLAGETPGQYRRRAG